MTKEEYEKQFLKLMGGTDKPGGYVEVKEFTGLAESYATSQVLAALDEIEENSSLTDLESMGNSYQVNSIKIDKFYGAIEEIRTRLTKESE